MGKYEVFLAGEKGIQKIDVPEEVNVGFDLAEGMSVSLIEGPYSWIVHSKSACFTGSEPEGFESSNITQVETAPPTPPQATAKRSPYPPKASPAPTPTPTVFATPKVGAPHSSWNQYQIDIRDPQMRMQALLEITANVHRTCIEQGCDPSEAMNAITSDAETLDKAVVKYLGL